MYGWHNSKNKIKLFLPQQRYGEQEEWSLKNKGYFCYWPLPLYEVTLYKENILEIIIDEFIYIKNIYSTFYHLSVM